MGACVRKEGGWRLGCGCVLLLENSGVKLDGKALLLRETDGEAAAAAAAAAAFRW